MTKNDPFAQIFPDTPRFELPSNLIFDSDADGVIDPWDCEPFNPDAEGWFGDAWKRATSYVRRATRVDYGRAAARRASVRRAVSRKAAPVTRRVRAAVRRVPTRPSRERAAERRQAVKRTISRKTAPVTRKVREVVAKAPIHPSLERAAERRAGVAAKFGVDFTRAAERRADVRAAGVIGAPKQVLRGIAGMGEPFRARPGAGVKPFAAYTPEAAVTRREAIVIGARPVTERFGMFSDPVGRRETKRELKEYESSLAKTQRMTAAHEKRFGGATEGTPKQVAEVTKSIAAIEAQRKLTEQEYGQYTTAFKQHEAAKEAVDPLSKKIPTLYDIADYGAPFREKHKVKIDVVRRGYERYSPKFAKEVIYPFAGGYAVGQYEELQKHPTKFVATTALFAVLPPALKGAGRVAKGAGVTRAVSKIPVAGKPLVTYGPKAVLTGVGALWAGSAGYRVYQAPTIEAKGRVAGEIMASEALPLAVAAGLPAMAAVTPTIVRAPGYKGIGIRGFKKPITEIIEVPKITRGGVYEAELLKKPPTIPKEIITGYARQPKPLLGIRSTKFTTPEGVTTTWKGVQVGKGWTPAEITKTHKLESVPGAEGTALAMEKFTQARLGQFRYEHAGFARGKIDPGYFLPEGKIPTKGLPELMTAEKGLVPVRDIHEPLLLTGGAPKPTRFYAEVSQPYMKAADMPLAGSPARMRWVEAGFRKVSYGVKGAPGVKQPRIEIMAEPWRTHPLTQTALGQTRAVVSYQPPIGAQSSLATYMVRTTPSSMFVPADIGGGILPSAPPVRQIPRSMYFHPEGAPSSRFWDVKHFLRPTAPKPAATPPVTPLKPVTTPKPVTPTRPPAPRRAPITEPVRVPEPTRVLAPEPMQAPGRRGVTFAKPVVSPVVKAILGDAKAAKVLQTGATCPFRMPSTHPSVTGVTAPTREGWWVPEARATPGTAPARQRTISEMLARTRRPAPAPRRRPFTVPEPTGEQLVGFVGIRAPAPITEFVTEPVVKAKEKRRPVPLPHPATATIVPIITTTFPDPIPDIPLSPSDGRVPPPPPPPPPVVTQTPPPPPLPPLPVIPKYPFGDSASAGRAAPRRRRPREWYLEHEMMTLEGFLGGVAKAPPEEFPEPDLGVPMPGGAAGTQARRPGLLDVPPGF